MNSAGTVRRARASLRQPGRRAPPGTQNPTRATAGRAVTGLNRRSRSRTRSSRAHHRCGRRRCGCKRPAVAQPALDAVAPAGAAEARARPGTSRRPARHPPERPAEHPPSPKWISKQSPCSAWSTSSEKTATPHCSTCSRPGPIRRADAVSVSSREEVSGIAPAKKGPLDEPAQAFSAKAKSSELVCPECGKTFTRPASLGAHRNRAHGVAGSSKPASASGKTATRASKRSASSRKEASTARREHRKRRSGRACRVLRVPAGYGVCGAHRSARTPQWIVTACFSRSSRQVSLPARK